MRFPLTNKEPKGRKAKTGSLLVPRKMFPRAGRWRSAVSKKAALQKIQTSTCLAPGCWPALQGVCGLPSYTQRWGRGSGMCGLQEQSISSRLVTERKISSFSVLLGPVCALLLGTSEGSQGSPWAEHAVAVPTLGKSLGSPTPSSRGSPD